MIRWKGLIAIATILGFFLFASIFIFTDKWFEEMFETFLTEQNNAKVELDGFKLSLTSMEISWDRLQYTNKDEPMRNLFETRRVEFSMEFIPLLSKKIVINKFEISEFRVNTERDESGEIQNLENSAETKLSNETEQAVSQNDKNKKSFIDNSYTEDFEQRLKDEFSSSNIDLSSLKNLDADKIVSSMKINSIHKIDSLSKDLPAKYKTLEEDIENVNIDKEIAGFKNLYNKIDLKKLKTVNDYKDALSNLDKTRKSIDNTSIKIRNARESLNNGIQSVKESTKNVQNWINEDYQHAMDLAKIPNIDLKSVGQMLLGKDVFAQIKMYLAYINTGRYYLNKLKSGEEKEEEPERLKGQDIRFSGKYARPDFWIKETKLSGYFENQTHLSGNIYDISSNQKFINKSTIIDLKGKNEKNGIALNVNADFNYLNDIAEEKLDVIYKNFPLNGYKLSQSGFLPEKIKKGNAIADFGIHLIDNKLNTKFNFIGENISFDFQKKAGNITERMIRNAISKTNKIDVIFSFIDGNVSFKTNLDDILGKSIKATIDSELRVAKAKIHKKIDQKLEPVKKKFGAIMSSKEKIMHGKLNQYQSKLDGEKKKIEDKKKAIEREQKKKFENKVKKGLKNLFNR